MGDAAKFLFIDMAIDYLVHQLVYVNLCQLELPSPTASGGIVLVPAVLLHAQVAAWQGHAALKFSAKFLTKNSHWKIKLNYYLEKKFNLCCSSRVA